MKSYNGNSLLFSCWSENSTVVFKVEFDEELLVTIMTELSNVYCKSSKKGPSKFSDTVPVLRSMTQACLQPRLRYTDSCTIPMLIFNRVPILMHQMCIFRIRNSRHQCLNSKRSKIQISIHKSMKRTNRSLDHLTSFPPFIA